jgi:hypothetical protein
VAALTILGGGYATIITGGFAALQVVALHHNMHEPPCVTGQTAIKAPVAI